LLSYGLGWGNYGSRCKKQVKANVFLGKHNKKKQSNKVAKWDIYAELKMKMKS
jgi:hypothetical protein